MPIKTIVRGYAIVVGLILMTAITIHMAVSLVERNPWVTLFNGPVAAPQEVAPAYYPSNASEQNTTRVLAAERSVPPDTTEPPAAADNQDAEFDRLAKQLALKFRTAKLTEQAKLRQELESLCEEHFEYRQKQRKWEIEQLSNRVDSLRLTQVTRQANKTEVLKRRLIELLDPDTNLRWDSSRTKDESTSAQIETRDPAQKLNVTTNPAQSNEIDTPETTYEGKTVTQWLSLLKTERSQAKIKDALRALSHLRNDADPRTLVQAIIGMSRSQSDLTDNNDLQSQNILHLAIAIFLEMPSNVVINEFLAELNKIFPQKFSVGFRSLFTTLIASNVQSGNFNAFKSNYYPRYYYFDIHNKYSFAEEIQQRSAEIIGSLTKFAEKDLSNDDWVIESAYYILGITEQSCSSHPDLILVAERVFSDSPSTERKAIAARFLGESGVHTHEVLGFFKETLPKTNFENGTSEFPLAQLSKLAEKVPEVVAVISDEFAERWKKFEAADRDSSGADCGALIDLLAEIGEPAKSVLPKLKSIVDTSAAQRVSQRSSTPTLYALSQQRPLLNQDHIREAIKQIEESKPKPKPEQPGPLLGLSLTDPIAKSSASTPSPSADAAPVVEKTFDGIPYSNWLKMLETERKPEKLATGMEACSRLADPRDEHRIAHGIILAAALFESSDEKEQQLVWNAGWTALKRFPAEVIAEELIVALQDDVSFKAGREFQGKLIAQKVSNAFESFPKDRTEVLIAELVKVIQTNVKGTGLLLAGASNVWRNSKRPLNDFESLQSLIFDAVDSGPKITFSGWSENISSAWKIIVSNLIQGAPEAPDLGVKLMKHAGKSSEVVELIGKLGPHGEPAVPLLVELFLEEWKRDEAECRDAANHIYHQRSDDETFRHHFRRCQIIQTIGEIGRGQNGYALLRQLILIAPPKNDRDAQFDGQLYGRVDDALAKFAPEPQSEPKPDLLSDFTLITGRWRFQAMSPGEAPKGATAEFKGSYMLLEEPDGNDFRFEKNSLGFAGFRFELDATKSPKQISLFKYQPESANRRAGTDAPLTEMPGTRMEGIYELTEMNLRIQLNEPGQPRPTELVTDKANLPKKQYLLEFDRSLDEKLTKTGTASP